MRREPPDLRKLSRAVIALAMAEMEAEKAAADRADAPATVPAAAPDADNAPADTPPAGTAADGEGGPGGTV